MCIHGYDNVEKLVDYLASLDRNVPTVEEMDLLIQGMLGMYIHGANHILLSHKCF